MQKSSASRFDASRFTKSFLRSRRPAPESLAGRAKFALSFVITVSKKNGRTKQVICESTPQWVADLFNASKDDGGVVDQTRQQYVIEALRLIRKGKFPSSLRSYDGDSKLRKWARSRKARSRYVQAAKDAAPPSTAQRLRLAQRLEKMEVFIQVLDRIVRTPYDGMVTQMAWA